MYWESYYISVYMPDCSPWRSCTYLQMTQRQCCPSEGRSLNRIFRKISPKSEYNKPTRNLSLPWELGSATQLQLPSPSAALFFLRAPDRVHLTYSCHESNCALVWRKDNEEGTRSEDFFFFFKSQVFSV